jgi:hypothetical protein
MWTARRSAPATPVFEPGRIVLQQVRQPYPSGVEHWPRMVTTTWQAEQRWLGEPDLARWIASNRLNLLRALPEHLAEPSAQAAVQRYVTSVGPAIERLAAWDTAAAG